MFTWVGSQFDAILNGYVLGVVSALISGLTPIALTAMTMWIVLYGWAVLRHEASESISVFVWKVTKIGVVLAFALQAGFYISTVSDTANGLAMGVATTFVPALVDPSTVAGPYEMLDRLNDNASAKVADIMKDASIFRLDLVLAGIIFSFGSVAFLCIAVFVVTLSKVFLTFVIAVGPLFILCLAWRPTARFFDSWLSMLLNAVVLTWFAFFALGLSSYVGASIFRAIDDGGGLLGGAFNVLGESIRYCVLMVLMGIICFQAPSLASALTGGAPVQHGMQMIQNAMMISGLRSASATRGSGAASAGGGTVRAGTGLPYAAGRATATAATATGVAAGAMSAGAGHLARSGYGAARTAAYKLAAMRGRT